MSSARPPGVDPLALWLELTVGLGQDEADRRTRAVIALALLVPPPAPFRVSTLLTSRRDVATS